MKVSRRTVLILLGAFGSTAAIGDVTLARTPHPIVASRSRLRSAMAIGRRWLETLETFPGQDELLTMILGPGHDRTSWTPERLQMLVYTRVREDFAAGRTVRVEGWVLARTEAWVYGLASLQGGQT